ncbi:MAG: LysM peptidoglycan-binding domain-containing protein [Paracoccus sp. (in: a-proteobacteria)]|nr:LysM peptidoglycan-binding domain-containing protein [Paracoccus sp. (in: a-proteobacteria)]
MSRVHMQMAAAVAALSVVASCGPNGGFDPDLRRWGGGGLATDSAAAAAPARPDADARGVITFSNGQVAVARAGDTPASVAARLGLAADELARHNALPADARLEAGAVLVLPRAVGAAPQAAAGASQGVGARGPVTVTDPFAGTSDRRGNASAPASAPPASGTPAPSEHVVAAGETAWSIARRYGITVQDLASWNGLPSDMDLRVGQRLLIPQPGQRRTAAAGSATTAPGQGSATPQPPSAARPLPDETTTPAADPGPEAPATDLGATRTAASQSRFRMPVSGPIIRTYERGRNDGIDIAASAGAAVSAAGSGTVAAITRDTAGTPIVVVRHDDELLTVYAGLKDVTVSRGDAIAAGQTLGNAGGDGFVHFEVRRGFESLDPERFIN